MRCFRLFRYSGLLLPVLFLMACAPGENSVSSGESAFVNLRQVQVGSVTYKVGRKSGTANSFVVTTSDGKRGSKKGASTAVLRAFKCQRVSLRPADDTWRKAEGKGSFCESFRDWQPLR